MAESKIEVTTLHDGAAYSVQDSELWETAVYIRPLPNGVWLVDASRIDWIGVAEASEVHPNFDSAADAAIALYKKAAEIRRAARTEADAWFAKPGNQQYDSPRGKDRRRRDG